MKQVAENNAKKLALVNVPSREEFFKEAEARLDDLIEEFDRRGKNLEGFVGAQIPKIRKLEESVNQMLDTMVVELHLGKMEADDLVVDLVARINDFIRKLNMKMDELKWETGEALKKLSDACLHLKVKIER